MILKACIHGLEQSGKTTLYNIVTGLNIDLISYSKDEPNLNVIDVPDENLDWLNKVYKAPKKVHSKIEIYDFNNNSLNNLFNADIICIVLRNFSNENVLHPLDSNDPVRDFKSIFADFILDDLKKVENRIEKLTNRKGQKLSNTENIELNLLQKIKIHLEDENPLNQYVLSENEELILKGYRFLTQKPFLCIINSDDELNENDTNIINFFETNGFFYFYIKGQLELELTELSPDDKIEYMKELGIKESGRNKLIKTIYKELNLINFYTTGKDEVRAWSIPLGTTAVKAAGSIHSDLEKGFIRAETVHITDAIKHGSIEECKKHNLVRLETKNYVVKNGDCMVIRFNV